MRNANRKRFGEKKAELDFSLKRVVLRPPSVKLLCKKKGIEKSQTNAGDGINDVFLYIYVHKNPGCCLECNFFFFFFLVMFTLLIISSVLGCDAVTGSITDQHIKHFQTCYLEQVMSVRSSNKTLTGNTSFYWLRFCCCFFLNRFT